MRESIPKLNRDKLLKEKELTEEQLEDLIEIKVSQGSTWEDIKKNKEGGAFLRFIVTKDFNVYLGPGNNTHDGIMEDNGLVSEDCVITNGALIERNNGNLIFSYQATPVTVLHLAAEKKIIKFFKDRGVELKSDDWRDEEVEETYD